MFCFEFIPSIFYVRYTLTVSFALGGLTGLFGDMMQALGASERVFQLIDRVPLIPVKGGYKVDSDDSNGVSNSNGITNANLSSLSHPSSHFSNRNKIEGLVEFRNVKFAYPSRQHTTVLNGINLKLEPGTVTALVGPSGECVIFCFSE